MPARPSIRPGASTLPGGARSGALWAAAQRRAGRAGRCSPGAGRLRLVALVAQRVPHRILPVERPAALAGLLERFRPHRLEGFGKPTTRLTPPLLRRAVEPLGRVQ